MWFGLVRQYLFGDLLISLLERAPSAHGRWLWRQLWALELRQARKKKLQPFGSCSELQVFLEPGGHFHHQAPPVLEGRLWVACLHSTYPPQWGVGVCSCQLSEPYHKPNLFNHWFEYYSNCCPRLKIWSSLTNLKLDDIYFYLECGSCRRNHDRLLTAVE